MKEIAVRCTVFRNDDDPSDMKRVVRDMSEANDLVAKWLKEWGKDIISIDVLTTSRVYDWKWKRES